MDRRAFLTGALAAPFVDASKAIAQTPVKPVLADGLPAPAWTQWGGPNRNFQTQARGLKDTWPAAGPPVVWKRALGEGYSAPGVENGVLYVMYGKPKQEVVMAADTETGNTLWEHTTPMTFQSDVAREMGNGPYSAPLVVGNRVFTTGVAGRLQCLDKKTGKLLWTQQLWEEHGGSELMYGYACSPIAFRETVIVPVGGRGRAVMSGTRCASSRFTKRQDDGIVRRLEVPVVEERLSVLEVQMQEVGATLVRIEDTLGGLVKMVTSLNERVDKLDQRVERLDQRVERLDQRVEKLDYRIDRLEQRVGALDQRVDKLDSRVEKQFLWVAGIQMTTLITIVAGLFGLVATLI